MALELIQLTDNATGSSAKVLAGFGFNCYEFRAVHLGEPVDVLWSAPGFESGQERPSHSGIPILFPFPGRIGGTSFEFKGRKYPLEEGDGRGNAIHGFVLNRPWQVLEHDGRRVVGRFQASQRDPSLLKRWPADFQITVSYELAGNTLASRIEVHNPDERPLPFGLGTHPYFRLPLGGKGQAADCRVTVPVGEVWELKDMVVTGKRLPAEGPKNLAGGLAFGQTQLDDVFTGLDYRGGRCTASIDDPANGRRLTMAFNDRFRACVVYNPPHREAICIEPYTCVPDGFRLEREGVDAGALVLGGGETLTFEIEIALEAS